MVVESTVPKSLDPANDAPWPRYPVVYEINTWVWLSELSQKYGENLSLSLVPAAEWEAIAANGFTAVWLMGVWERSPAGIAIANQDQRLLDDFQRALPGVRPDDNVGSPYCVRGYQVDPHLGGSEALAAARRELSSRGIKLILDYVPNHVAMDHPWVTEHPEYLILGDDHDLRDDPAGYIEVGGIVYARGRDPYFPAWPDVVQLNAFAPGLRAAAIETITTIARQCDGIRCDMAMLLLNEIFARTWGSRARPSPATEYWTDIISAVHTNHPAFLLIAEAYWDKEWELQQLGFDFCYDKKLYDLLAHGNAESLRWHLGADQNYQERLLRFIENHDEPRVAAIFPPEKQQVAALIVATLPGMKLFHEGQFEGRNVRLPVFLRRRPHEVVDQQVQSFYQHLLHAIDRPCFRDGHWSICEPKGWPDNSTFQNVLAWNWQKDSECYLIVVNFCGSSSQAQVQLPGTDAWYGEWLLQDIVSGVIYPRRAEQMRSSGLYIDLGPWKYHFFACRAA
jgi:Alpha amylase, catalytic domain